MSVCVSPCVIMCVHFWGVHVHRDHLCVCMGVDLGVCMCVHECPCVHTHTSADVHIWLCWCACISVHVLLCANMEGTCAHLWACLCMSECLGEEEVPVSVRAGTSVPC